MPDTELIEKVALESKNHGFYRMLGVGQWLCRCGRQHGPDDGTPSMALERHRAEMILKMVETEAQKEVERLTSMLSVLGFCPKDGDSMPCTTCGAGL